VDETILDRDLVSFSLKGFTKAWESFIDVICAREKLSDWEQLWGDCVQEELCRHAHSGSHIKTEDEENIALASKGGKSKDKKNDGGGALTSKGKKKKKDRSKIKCFSYH